MAVPVQQLLAVVVDVAAEGNRDRADPRNPLQEIVVDDGAVLDAVVEVGTGMHRLGRLKLLENERNRPIPIGVYAHPMAILMDLADDVNDFNFN